MRCLTPNDIITLTTDFGTRDVFVGVMKAVMLSINPNTRLIDITHEIAPQDIQSGSFLFNAAHRAFPTGTTHLVVIDPGVGGKRKGVAVQTDDYFMVAPDNGVLTEAITSYANVRSVYLENSSYFLSVISNTFHGRDIFAPVAAYLSLGTPITEFGPATTDLVRVPISQPQITNDCIRGQIRYIDTFGNLITNITDYQFREFCGESEFEIRIHDIIIQRLSRSYDALKEESVFAIINSFNLLELASYKRSAADELGACAGTPVEITR